jgi:SprT protein
MDTSLELKVFSKLKELEALSDEIFGINIYPEINFNLAGRVGGIAYSKNNVIKLNKQLLEENGEKFINEVLPHEFAHLITRKIHGNKVKSHGNEWKSILNKLGNIAKRTHDFKTTPAKIHEHFEYRMNCGCKFIVGNKIHSNIHSGNSKQYQCKHKILIQSGDWWS